MQGSIIYDFLTEEWASGRVGEWAGERVDG
jgi:hypothetical protein